MHGCCSKKMDYYAPEPVGTISKKSYHFVTCLYNLFSPKNVANLQQRGKKQKSAFLENYSETERKRSSH